MIEIKYDNKLSIRTSGIKEWDGDIIHYNRCEPTPYKALIHLFKHYKLEKTDRLVDFGSGKGRVAFYVHNRFKIPVVGIEAQDSILSEALQNKKMYRTRAKNITAPISFEFGLAEDYEVKPEDTKFFFFNPFSADVFREVLHNIMLSLKQVKREVHIILFYPLPDYQKIMRKNSSFEIYNKIIVPKVRDRREKFIIYRHLPA